MAIGLKLEACKIQAGDSVPHIAVTIRNSGSRRLEPGGVRFILGDGRGNSQRVSAPHLWPLEVDETATVVGALAYIKSPVAIEQISNFEYIEFSGACHPVDGSASISILRGLQLNHQS